MASESKYQLPTENVLPSKGVSDEEVELHAGDIHVIRHVFGTFTNLAVKEIVFNSPDKYVHMDWDVASDSIVSVDYYKNASYVGASTQTQLIPFNPNFTVSEDSGTMLVYANSSPAFSAGSEGALYAQGMLMGGNVISVGGGERAIFICETAQWYVIRMANTSGASGHLAVQIRYHGQE